VTLLHHSNDYACLMCNALRLYEFHAVSNNCNESLIKGPIQTINKFGNLIHVERVKEDAFTKCLDKNQAARGSRCAESKMVLETMQEENYEDLLCK
jgi:hypothetical protein